MTDRPMQIMTGDTLILKKTHPCGSREWKVMRTGSDIRLVCLGCGHVLLLPRSKVQKNLKDIRHSS